MCGSTFDWFASRHVYAFSMVQKSDQFSLVPKISIRSTHEEAHYIKIHLQLCKTPEYFLTWNHWYTFCALCSQWGGNKVVLQSTFFFQAHSRDLLTNFSSIFLPSNGKKHPFRATKETIFFCSHILPPVSQNWMLKITRNCRCWWSWSFLYNF